MRKDRNPTNERRRIFKAITKKGIERFYLVTVDVESTNGEIKELGTEIELRKELESSGTPPDEIDSTIANVECLGRL